MVTDLILNQNIIDRVKYETVLFICDALGKDITKIILYGSCSRGDFSDDSDIDIALIVACDRTEINKYNDLLSEAAAKLAVKYLAIVNFVCVPENEFEERKEWYPYYKNIDREGELLYGRQVLQ